MAWPTTDDPRTEFVTVRFTESEHNDILWLQGVTNAKDRSAVVRSCVDRVVAAEQRKAKRTKHRGGVQDKDVLADTEGDE